MNLLLLLALFSAPQSPPSCQTDAIVAHLDTVVSELSAADTSHLSPSQKANRARHIAVLTRYRDAGRFPAQTFAPDRLVTVFVDDQDVHCAVGHLMAMDGRHDLVQAIRKTRNTATIQELGHDPAVLAWLESAGLSPYEAARIQPAYCGSNKAGDCLCNDQVHMGAVAGVAEATITTLNHDPITVTATLDLVHGTGASPGDSFTVTMIEGDVVGRKILVLLRTEHLGTTLEAARGQTPFDNYVSCTSTSPMDGAQTCAYVPASLYIDALRSQDCLSVLGQYDARLEMSVCDLTQGACLSSGLPPSNSDDAGCGSGPGPVFWSLLLLMFEVVRRHLATPRPTR